MSTTELTDGQRNRIALMTIVRREVARGHFQGNPLQGLGAVVVGLAQVAHAQGGRRIVLGCQARSLRAHGLALERGGEGLL